MAGLQVRRPPGSVVVPLRDASPTGDAAVSLYHALRERGVASMSEIDAALGLTVGASRPYWEYLQKVGLVRQAATAGDVEAVHPDSALNALNAERQAQTQAHLTRLTEIQHAAGDLERRFQPLIAREAGEVDVEVLRARRRRQEYLNDACERTAVQTRSMHPGPLAPKDILDVALQVDADMIDRGIDVRAVYPQSAIKTPQHRRYLESMVALGAEVRLGTHIPYDLLLFDAHTAILPADPLKTADGILAVTGSALMPTYIALWERCWLQAVPFHPAAPAAVAAPAVLDAQQHVVLTMLAHGKTDEQISRDLGISTRTVGRVVRAMMEILGATSRVQAGMIAASRGLVKSV